MAYSQIEIHGGRKTNRIAFVKFFRKTPVLAVFPGINAGSSDRRPAKTGFPGREEQNPALWRRPMNPPV